MRATSNVAKHVAPRRPTGEHTTDSTALTMFAASSTLHVTNFTGLVWLRKQCRACMERAEKLFDIDNEAALFYRDLPDREIEALCRELDVSLFIPRFDSRTLPATLAAVAGNCRERKPTELELHNLGHLQALRDACHRSAGDAVWIYRVNRETADAYHTLEHHQVVALCKTLTVCALLPRYDATEAARILDKPAGSRALFAAAYETEIAAASEADRRSAYLTH
jgi:hypothetical protein